MLRRLLLASIAFSEITASDWTTAAGDSMRSGYSSTANLDPTIVSDHKAFGPLFITNLPNVTSPFAAQPVPPGPVYAAPLLYTPPGQKQVLFVATMNNNLYAVDAVAGTVLSSRSVNAPFDRINDIPACGDIDSNVGVVGTPVIDPATSTAYFVAKTYVNPAIHGVDNADYVFHAVDVLSLAERPGFPVSLRGQQSQNDHRKYFQPGRQLQRPGLLLMDNAVYIGFGGICDMYNYTGWIMGFDKSTGVNVAAWTTDSAAANTGGAGVWMGGSGLASDRSGSVFFNVANGNPSYTSPMSGSSPPLMTGQCAMRLDVQASRQLAAADYFLMYDYEPLNLVDLDFGSGGFTMFPRTTASGQPAFGGHKLATGIGKSGIVYVMNPDSLGGFMQGASNSDNVIQRITGPGVVFGQAAAYPEEGGYFYFYPSISPIQAYKYGQDANGNAEFNYAGQTDITPAWFTGSPIVSSLNGQPGSGILWFIDRAGFLYAYSAVPSGGKLKQLYSHSPGPGTYSKWLRPTIGSGRVFTVTNDGRVFSFGSPSSFPLSAPATAFGTVTVGSSVALNVTFTAHIATTIVSLAVGDPDFALVSNPSLPMAVQPNQVFNLTVLFQPASFGSFASTLLVETSSGAPSEFSASLSGVGQLSGPTLIVSPNVVSYGGVVSGSGAVNIAVLISNSGNQVVSILGYSLPSAPFSALALPPIGMNLTVGASVSMSIQFYPTSNGVFSSSFSVLSNGGSQTVTLTGIGAAPPQLVLQMQNLDGTYSVDNLNMTMGSLYPNTNRTLNVIISNAGNSTLVLSKVKPPLTGNIYTSPSSVVEGQQLPVGGQIVVPITFLLPPSNILASPPIPFNAVFIINTNDPVAGLQTISFSGTEIFSPLAAPFQRAMYLGCFTDGANARVLPTQQWNLGSLAIETCLKACTASGFRYAGVEFGVECYCGNQPPLAAVGGSTACTMACSGNSAEICGGSAAISVFDLTPNGIATSSTTASASLTATPSTSLSVTPLPTTAGPSNPSVTNWSFIGCFVDSAVSRTVPTQRWNLASLTVEICLASCVKGGFKYGGMEFGSQCFCGNSVPVAASSTACTMPCQGNSTEVERYFVMAYKETNFLFLQLCGGVSAISVYGPGVSVQSSSQTTSIPTLTGLAIAASTSVSYSLSTNSGATLSQLGSASSTSVGTSNSTLPPTAQLTSTQASIPTPSSTNAILTGSLPSASSYTSLTLSPSVSFPPSPSASITNGSSILTTSFTSTSLFSASASASVTVSSISSSSVIATSANSTSISTGVSQSSATPVVSFLTSASVNTTTGSSSITSYGPTSSGQNTSQATVMSTFSASAGATSSSTLSAVSNSVTNFLSSISSPTLPTTVVQSTPSVATTSTQVVPYNPTVPNWSYLGCFTDSLSVRTVAIQQWNLPSLTVEICLAACISGGFQYGGVEYGSECYCGYSLPTAASSNACSMTCQGNAAELCGGPSAISVYGPAVSSLQSSTGASQSSVTVFPTSTPALPINPTVPNWSYIGCFTDSLAMRTIPTQQWNLASLTVEICLTACVSGGFKYGGVEFGSQCFCGNSSPTAALSSLCSIPCQGNTAEVNHHVTESIFQATNR
ncbi:hypothetical protein HDU98_003546 [Podochytrium sp. JEL0797]|nr:hypothetical protein HDU98_003546 [Podochytrium sp. JEL0797]